MPPNTKARLLGRSSPIQGSTPTHAALPPRPQMAAICVSPDGEDCIIEDIFRVPDCSTSWVVLEPSMYYLQDQFSQELGA